MNYQVSFLLTGDGTKFALAHSCEIELYEQHMTVINMPVNLTACCETCLTIPALMRLCIYMGIDVN